MCAAPKKLELNFDVDAHRPGPRAARGLERSQGYSVGMGRRVWSGGFLLAATAVTAVASAQVRAARPETARHAMVVSIHHDATDAGVEMLREGGNAVDAAVAVGFALAVVYPAAGNIGGGGFMLIRRVGEAGRRQGALSGLSREGAGGGEAGDVSGREGECDPEDVDVGAKASGVPGTVAGLALCGEALRQAGAEAKVMAPAIRLARDGFVLRRTRRGALHHAKLLARFPESQRIFQRDGKFYKAGETFKQPDLARTLERIAANPEDFYKGKMARRWRRLMQQERRADYGSRPGGVSVQGAEPLVGHYRGLRGADVAAAELGRASCCWRR